MKLLGKIFIAATVVLLVACGKQDEVQQEELSEQAQMVRQALEP